MSNWLPGESNTKSVNVGPLWGRLPDWGFDIVYFVSAVPWLFILIRDIIPCKFTALLSSGEQACGLGWSWFLVGPSLALTFLLTFTGAFSRFSRLLRQTPKPLFFISLYALIFASLLVFMIGIFI